MQEGIIKGVRALAVPDQGRKQDDLVRRGRSLRSEIVLNPAAVERDGGRRVIRGENRARFPRPSVHALGKLLAEAVLVVVRIIGKRPALPPIGSGHARGRRDISLAVLHGHIVQPQPVFHPAVGGVVIGEIFGRSIPEAADHRFPFLPHGLSRTDRERMDAEFVITHVPDKKLVQKCVQRVIRAVKMQQIIVRNVRGLILVQGLRRRAGAEHQRRAEHHGQNAFDPSHLSSSLRALFQLHDIVVRRARRMQLREEIPREVDIAKFQVVRIAERLVIRHGKHAQRRRVCAGSRLGGNDADVADIHRIRVSADQHRLHVRHVEPYAPVVLIQPGDPVFGRPEAVVLARICPEAQIVDGLVALFHPRPVAAVSGQPAQRRDP